MYTKEKLDIILSNTTIGFEPKELQMQDAVHAANCGQYGLFYDVGVGKTVVSTLTALLWGKPHNIVVCPPILNSQWASWLRSIGETDIQIYETTKRKTEMLGAKWVIMSHAIFRDDASIIHKFFAKKEYAIIIDEAQALKNPKSKLYREVRKLSMPDKEILLLTGTPTTKPQDTYTYMKLKTPDIYRSVGHWDNIHVDERDFFGTITKYKNLELLSENFAINSVFRGKREMFGDTIEPIYQPIDYKLSDKHLRLYNKLAEEQLLLLPNGDKIDAATAQRLRHALQQIVVNFSVFSGNPADVSAAYQILDNTLEEVNPMVESNSKLIVWTYYQSSSKAIYEYLKNLFGNEAVVAAYGGSNAKKAVEEIQFNDKCRILVAHPKSCGAGLNLQHNCSENLFLEMPTSPIDMRQSIGRTDRAGQTIRPTFRFAKAIGTIQMSLFEDLLKNDDLKSQVERSPRSLRDEIFGT